MWLVEKFNFTSLVCFIFLFEGAALLQLQGWGSSVLTVSGSAPMWLRELLLGILDPLWTQQNKLLASSWL
jgi:hypothetical protein